MHRLVSCMICMFFRVSSVVAAASHLLAHECLLRLLRYRRGHGWMWCGGSLSTFSQVSETISPLARRGVVNVQQPSFGYPPNIDFGYPHPSDGRTSHRWRELICCWHGCCRIMVSVIQSCRASLLNAAKKNSPVRSVSHQFSSGPSSPTPATSSNKMLDRTLSHPSCRRTPLNTSTGVVETSMSSKNCEPKRKLLLTTGRATVHTQRVHTFLRRILTHTITALEQAAVHQASPTACRHLCVQYRLLPMQTHPRYWLVKQTLCVGVYVVKT